VVLRLGELLDVSVSGRLVDVSSSGFRVRHGSRALATGQIVEFAYENAAGRARVAWTTILGEHVESGFLIIGFEPD
jgi:hypothetical protein